MKPLVYLCGEYPRATDTFIQREVTALRNEGFHVETLSVRRPAEGERGTHEQDEERRGTYYLLPCSPFHLAGSHLRLFLRSPKRYFGSLVLALKVRSPGIRSFIYQLFYFAEAGLVAARMSKRGLIHIHNHAPDACGYVTMLASSLGGFTYSMTLHGFGIFSEPKRWRLQEKIEHSLFTVCISRHGKSQAMLWSNRKSWDKIHIVHCGVDSDAAVSRHHEGRGKNILFVGRLDHVKGLPLLIEAFLLLSNTYRDIYLHIIGDGPERSDLESLIRENHLDERVLFYGYLSQSELKTIYAKADVFVMTSFFEGIPVVLMEAMSFGVPVVAPRITGIPELVQEDVEGMLTTPADPVCLAESIETLLNDSEKRNRFAAEGRKKIEREYNLKKETGRLVEIMHRYLG